jgi:hypothetical protein
LVRRCDLPTIKTALEQAGFVHGELLDVVMFRDGPEGKPSETIHLLFAGEKTRSDHLLATPEIQTVRDPANYPVITLEAPVSMKLMSHRLKDRVHLQDLIGVGLIDATWVSKFPPELAERLQRLLDTPEG